MLTVIFLSHTARSLLETHQAYFAPFLDSGEIAFCDWNEDAEDPADAFPHLPEIIRGVADWRAVVVDHIEGGSDPTRDDQNPFDFVDNADTALSFEPSPHALVRMTHFLLGYPALTTKEFTPVVVYRDSTTGAVMKREPGELTQFERLPGESDESVRSRAVTRQAGRLALEHTDVQIQYDEVKHSPDEQRRHVELTARYAMKENLPTEVALVSTRTPATQDERIQLRRAWQSEPESGMSRFVDRNDYPAATRFVVYDLVGRDHSAYAQGVMDFWMSVLTISLNQLPPGAFQADRLYEIDVAIDAAALSGMLSSHISTLSALREHLSALMLRPSRPPEADPRSLVAQRSVSVEFEKLDDSGLVLSETGYGIASDYPINEAQKWAADFSAVEGAAAQFVRLPRRVLARAVFDARQQMRDRETGDVTLSEIEREELEEDLAGRMRTLTTPSTADILARRRLADLLSEQRARGARAIARRMRIQTVAIASAIVLFTWLASFVPYLIQASRMTPQVLLWSVFTVSTVLVVIGAVGAITLIAMRKKLLRVVREANSALHRFVTDVEGGAQRFAAYLSELVTYMNARSRLLGSRRLEDAEMKRRRRVRAILNDVDDAMAVELDVLKALAVRSDVRRINLPTSTFDATDPAQVRRLFEFPPSRHDIPVNESGESIQAPYDFITALRIERERIVEPVRHRGDS